MNRTLELFAGAKALIRMADENNIKYLLDSDFEYNPSALTRELSKAHERLEKAYEMMEELRDFITAAAINKEGESNE